MDLMRNSWCSMSKKKFVKVRPPLRVTSGLGEVTEKSAAVTIGGSKPDAIPDVVADVKPVIAKSKVIVKKKSPSKSKQKPIQVYEDEKGRTLLMKIKQDTGLSESAIYKFGARLVAKTLSIS